ncbi:hypothetical protein [Arvimicrobium flavum]|uniref:hypothetical protein n=1 Tax=Arvimicrobium flavum TaxID=3393320 RepID=UPI00237B95B0|nr:hypothetical protein [Mesorhizobium shangrilense]
MLTSIFAYFGRSQQPQLTGEEHDACTLRIFAQSLIALKAAGWQIDNLDNAVIDDGGPTKLSTTLALQKDNTSYTCALSTELAGYWGKDKLQDPRTPRHIAVMVSQGPMNQLDRIPLAGDLRDAATAGAIAASVVAVAQTAHEFVLRTRQELEYTQNLSRSARTLIVK